MGAINAEEDIKEMEKVREEEKNLKTMEEKYAYIKKTAEGKEMKRRAEEEEIQVATEQEEEKIKAKKEYIKKEIEAAREQIVKNTEEEEKMKIAGNKLEVKDAFKLAEEEEKIRIHLKQGVKDMEQKSDLAEIIDQQVQEIHEKFLNEKPVERKSKIYNLER